MTHQAANTRLSPAVSRGLFTRFVLMDDTIGSETKPKKLSAYECPDCGDLYEDKYDAQTCCSPIKVEAYQCSVCSDIHRSEKRAVSCCPAQDPAMLATCPICATAFGQFGDAADPAMLFEAASCCMTIDLDVATRWSLAYAVRNGSSWIEAIHKFTTGVSA